MNDGYDAAKAGSTSRNMTTVMFVHYSAQSQHKADFIGHWKWQQAGTYREYDYAVCTPRNITRSVSEL